MLSVLGFVVNLLPLFCDGLYSDGAQLFQLLQKGSWAQLHVAQAMAGSMLVGAMRPQVSSGPCVLP